MKRSGSADRSAGLPWLTNARSLVESTSPAAAMDNLGLSAGADEMVVYRFKRCAV